MKIKAAFVVALLTALGARAQELQAPEPFLVCRDVGAQLAFYTEQLGFSVEVAHPEGAPAFARIARGECKIMMMAAASIPSEEFQTQYKAFEGKPKGLTNFLYIRVDNVDKLYNEIRARGVTFEGEFRDGPVDREWGSRDLIINDPEGFVLVFTSNAAL